MLNEWHLARWLYHKHGFIGKWSSISILLLFLFCLKNLVFEAYKNRRIDEFTMFIFCLVLFFCVCTKRDANQADVTRRCHYRRKQMFQPQRWEIMIKFFAFETRRNKINKSTLVRPIRLAILFGLLKLPFIHNSCQSSVNKYIFHWIYCFGASHSLKVNVAWALLNR